MTIWDDLKRQYAQGDATIRLIMINVAIFILINIVYVPVFLMGYGGVSNGPVSQFMQEWFYLPSDLTQLVFRPWTLITYMFLHQGFWHILFNMLLLYWFGRIINDLLPNSKIIPLYILGGLAGGIFFILLYNIFPVFITKDPMLGASASVMAIVLATATLNPKGSIHLFLLGRIELQYVALVLVLLDIIFIPAGNSGGRIAHLGGAAMGWFYIFQMRRGNDMSKPFNRFFAMIKGLGKGKKSAGKAKGNSASDSGRRRSYSEHVFYGSARRQPDENNLRREYGRTFAQTYRNMSKEECVDAILDKIRRSGYDSLTEEEKSFLDKTSEK